jgi:hypothetical protein
MFYLIESHKCLNLPYFDVSLSSGLPHALGPETPDRRSP